MTLSRDDLVELQRRCQLILDAIERIPHAELPKDPDSAFAVLTCAVTLLKQAGHSKREIATAVANVYGLVGAQRRN